MLKNKLYQKLLVAGIVGTLIISSGVVAFAATTGSTATKHKIECKSVGGTRGENPITSVLTKEVTAGVITQAESDAITSYLTTKEATNKTAMEALKAKLATMTDAEKKSYMEANKPVRTDLLADLVTANLLTQTQADTIKAAMPQGHEGGMNQGGKPGFGMQKGNPLTSILAKEVTAGVITQAESDSATAFIKTKEDTAKATRDAEKAKYDAMTDAEKKTAMDAKKAEMTAQKAKLDAMTDAEKKAYFEANKPAKDNILADLVTANILTQDQANKIQAAMPQRPEMRKGHVGKAKVAPTTSTATE